MTSKKQVLILQMPNLAIWENKVMKASKIDPIILILKKKYNFKGWKVNPIIPATIYIRFQIIRIHF
jgi:hypothetical protein